jgi:hypothetical protein
MISIAKTITDTKSQVAITNILTPVRKVALAAPARIVALSAPPRGMACRYRLICEWCRVAWVLDIIIRTIAAQQTGRLAPCFSKPSCHHSSSNS